MYAYTVKKSSNDKKNQKKTEEEWCKMDVCVSEHLNAPGQDLEEKTK